MNNEVMLKRLVEMVDSECNVNPALYNQLMEDLKADIRMDNNKAKGCGNLAKLAKAIFKSAPESSKSMQYAHTENGIQWILDGYRIAGFYEAIDLPEYDDYKEKCNLSPTWFDVSKIIDGVEYDETPLPLPTIGELKSEIKIAKAGKPRGIRVMCKLECGPLVNAQFLLDFMEAFPDMKIYPSANRMYNSPLFIESEKGVGILLPIHMKRDDMETGIHTEW